MKPVSQQDYYETLEISRNAGEDEIERAYRLAHSTYSDDSLAGYSVFEEGDADVLRERIEIAYRTLRDPQARAAYDREMDEQSADEACDTSGSDPEVFATGVPVPAAAEREPLDSFEALSEQGDEWDGPALRRERLRQGIELEQIADVTKVNPTYLRFIEDENFDDLPAEVYVRGFVQGYAGCLGLDPRSVAASYLERSAANRGDSKRRLFSRR